MERSTLNQIQVASPCTVAWASMKGDDQVRHCGECKLNVYNLSAMSLGEITRLLEKKEGRVCVRFYRRADGTVITDDCPVGLRAVRLRLAMISAAAASLIATLGFGVFASRAAMARTLKDSLLGQITIVRAFADWIEPEHRAMRRVTAGMPKLPMLPVQPVPPVSGMQAAPAPLQPVQSVKGEMVLPAPEVKMGKMVCRPLPESNPAAAVHQGRR